MSTPCGARHIRDVDYESERCTFERSLTLTKASAISMAHYRLLAVPLEIYVLDGTLTLACRAPRDTRFRGSSFQTTAAGTVSCEGIR